MNNQHAIISILNQKGGTTKSTIARTLAVEFENNKWSVHLADMDTTQKTSFNWAGRRAEEGVKPSIEVALYREPKAALKASNNTDLLIIDGKAFADNHVLEIAKVSTLIVLPVGISTDDLEPTLKLAMELVNKGIEKKAILFVVSKVMKSGEKEAMNTRKSIKDWGFSVTKGWIPFRTAYSQAIDNGRALTETKYKNLNETTDKIIQQIFDRSLELIGN